MKKLVYLLILSLCMSGLSNAALGWGSPAWAEEKTEAKQEEKSEKSKKEKKAGKEKKSKKSDKSEKAKEDVYTYDLNGTGAALLSTVIKDCRIDVSLGKVKGIEGVGKNIKKYVSWGQDPENKKDYVITVLKDFKEAQLRVTTKKSSFILKLTNGAKEKQTEVEKEPKADAVSEKAGKADAPEAQALPAEAVERTSEKAAEASVERENEEKAADESAGVEKTPESSEEQSAADAPENAQGEAGQDAKAQETADAPATDEGERGEKTEVEKPEDAAEQGDEGGDSETDAGQGQNPEGEAFEGQTPEGGAEGEASEEQTPEGEASEGQTPEDGAAEGEAAEGQTPEGGAEGEASEGQTPEDGAAEGETSEGQTPEGGVAEGETPEGQDAGGEVSGGDAPEAGGEVIPEDAEAWFERDGVQIGGTLKQIVERLQGGEKVYLRTKSTLFLPDAPLKLLSGVELLPDGDVFNGDYTVCLSQDNPATADKPVLVATAALADLGTNADLYIWVAKTDSLTPEEPADPTDPEEHAPQIAVAAENYHEATWMYTPPRFELSGIPEGKPWSYAAIIYDERFVPISGTAYVPLEEGMFTLRFAILDEFGDILSVSGQYDLRLDWTEPEDVSIDVDEDDSLTMYITASDKYSGVAGVSLNAGRSWTELSNYQTFSYTAKKEKTFSAGSIQVRDAAGNVYAYDSDYTLEEPEEDDGEGGGGGGGGGGGEAKPVPSHASGDGDEGVEYDALTLEIPDEPMEQLTVGGEAMQLTLLLESAQLPEAPVGEKQYFTASLRHWASRSDDAPDTLLLSAELDANLGDEFSYDWRFNGEVYRMLANSGIKYVALQVGDDVAAFPTEGFTGGTKYTELKMLGVSTRRFDYTLTMKVNLNPGHVSAMSDSDYSQACDLSIRTEVENMNYELSSSPKSIMYFYNVFLGPEDMLEQPFGESKLQG